MHNTSKPQSYSIHIPKARAWICAFVCLLAPLSTWAQQEDSRLQNDQKVQDKKAPRDFTVMKPMPAQASTHQFTNYISREEKALNYTLVFDGQTASNWHGFKQNCEPSNWTVDDAALHRMAPSSGEDNDECSSDSLVFGKPFTTFTLKLEWKSTVADPSAAICLISAPVSSQSSQASCQSKANHVLAELKLKSSDEIGQWQQLEVAFAQDERVTPIPMHIELYAENAPVWFRNIKVRTSTD